MTETGPPVQGRRVLTPTSSPGLGGRAGGSPRDRRSPRAGCDLTFHGSGSQVAGTPGRTLGAAGTRGAIVHQLQVRCVEGVRPGQVRHGREHPPAAGEGERKEMRDPGPGQCHRSPREPGRLRALEEVTASSPRDAEPDWAHRQDGGHQGPRALRPAPSAARPGRTYLPKMANTQPLARQGCGSQRPNVLPARRSVPFARRHRDARAASPRRAPLISGEQRGARASPRPPSNLIPAPGRPRPFRLRECAGGSALRRRILFYFTFF